MAGPLEWLRRYDRAATEDPGPVTADGSTARALVKASFAPQLDRARAESRTWPDVMAARVLTLVGSLPKARSRAGPPGLPGRGPGGPADHQVTGSS